jgi:hypothetical protein
MCQQRYLTPFPRRRRELRDSRGKTHLTTFPDSYILARRETRKEEDSMDVETRSTDSKGRICLPKAFANATVIIDQVSDTEVRIRKAVVIPEAEVRFYEETATPLSDRDRDRFLDLLDNPPAATAALTGAMRKHAKPHG